MSLLCILQLLDISPDMSMTKLVPVQLLSVGMSSPDVLPEPLPPNTAMWPSLLTGEKNTAPFSLPKMTPCALSGGADCNIEDCCYMVRRFPF